MLGGGPILGQGTPASCTENEPCKEELRIREIAVCAVSGLPGGAFGGGAALE